MWTDRLATFLIGPFIVCHLSHSCVYRPQQRGHARLDQSSVFLKIQSQFSHIFTQSVQVLSQLRVLNIRFWSNLMLIQTILGKFFIKILLEKFLLSLLFKFFGKKILDYILLHSDLLLKWVNFVLFNLLLRISIHFMNIISH